MKKMDFLQILNTYVIPSLIIALGCILLLHPDSASALIAKLIGWILVIGGGAAALTGLRENNKTPAGLILAVAALAGGIWLLTHPMMLASVLGRFLGAALLYWGGREVWAVYQLRRAGNSAAWPMPATVIAAAGLILFFLPLSASRLLFRVVGLVVAALGISELLRRLKGRKYLDDGSGPDIIDAL